MSISNNPPPIPPRRDLGQKDSRSTQKQASFKAELAKAVYAYAERVEGSTSQSSTPKSDGVQSESSVKYAKSPGPTSESENVKKKDSMKKRFLKAILRRDFPGAYREISQKVTLERFQQWLAKTLPDIDPSFGFDDDFRTFVGAEAVEVKTKAVEVKTKAAERKTEAAKGELEVDQPVEVPEKFREAGTKILAQVDNDYMKGSLYKCKYAVVGDINNQLKATEGQKKAKAYQGFLKELKVELEKDNPDPEVIKKMASKPANKQIVAQIFPSFTLTLTPEEFKQQFLLLSSGLCDVIDQNLDEEGLFRLPGSVATQGVIITRLLSGESAEKVGDDYREAVHYCSAVKSLTTQLARMEKNGSISKKDLKEMIPAFQRIHDTLQKVTDDKHKNKMTMDNISLAAPDTCKYLDEVLKTNYVAKAA